MSLIYGIIVAVILIIIYDIYKSPENFVILRDAENREVVLSPLEATRLGIKTKEPVYDGRDRVF